MSIRENLLADIPNGTSFSPNLVVSVRKYWNTFHPSWVLDNTSCVSLLYGVCVCVCVCVCVQGQSWASVFTHVCVCVCVCVFRARAEHQFLPMCVCVCVQGQSWASVFTHLTEKIIKRMLQRRLAGKFSLALRNNQSKMPVVKWVIKALGNQYLTFCFRNGGCYMQF